MHIFSTCTTFLTINCQIQIYELVFTVNDCLLSVWEIRKEYEKKKINTYSVHTELCRRVEPMVFFFYATWTSYFLWYFFISHIFTILFLSIFFAFFYDIDFFNTYYFMYTYLWKYCLWVLKFENLSRNALFFNFAPSTHSLLY